MRSKVPRSALESGNALREARRWRFFDRLYNYTDCCSRPGKWLHSIMDRSYGYKYYSIPLLQAFVASASILSVATTPFTLSSSIASTTASATRSAFSGFSTAAPTSGVSLPPNIELTIFPAAPNAAIGIVNALEESYKNPGLIKILLILGKVDAMVDSASRFVDIYLDGSMGVPAAADM